jgi:mono/diheme cytochrome c family protein
MKNFLLGFIATIVLLPAGLIGYLRLGGAEVRADVHAPAWQDRLFHFAVHAAVRRSAPKAQHSARAADSDLIAGGKLYLDDCAGCHGRPGGRRRKLIWFFPPPELAYIGTQYAEPELAWIIQHGIRRTAMSAQGPSYTEKQRWLLAEFVGHMKDLPPPVLNALQPKKP